MNVAAIADDRARDHSAHLLSTTDATDHAHAAAFAWRTPGAAPVAAAARTGHTDASRHAFDARVLERTYLQAGSRLTSGWRVLSAKRAPRSCRNSLLGADDETLAAFP